MASAGNYFADDKDHKGPFYVHTVNFDKKDIQILMFETLDQFVKALTDHDKEMIKYEPSSVPLYDPKLTLFEYAQNIIDKSKIVMIEYKSGYGWVSVIEGGMLIASTSFDDS